MRINTTNASLIFNRRYILPSMILFGIVFAMFIHGPIAQPPNYHLFADHRSYWNMDNAANVLSNIGFAMVGIWGLLHLAKYRTDGAPARVAYAVFFASVFLTAFGSTWYHLAPDNSRLIYDRIPIAIACLSLLFAVWQECYARTELYLRNIVICIGLILLAYASVLWWQITDERYGLGDLRAYLLLQILPLVLIPIIQWQANINKIKRRAFGVAILLYVLAKITELQDYALLHHLGFISGHTIKHILAALAAAVLVWQLKPKV